MTPIDPIMKLELPPLTGCIQFQEGFLYQATHDAIYPVKLYPPKDIETKFVSLSTTGILRIKAGFAWNGVSGPTINRNSNRRGGAFHDALYRLRRFGLLDFMSLEEFRRIADETLREIWIADGMWAWLAAVEVTLLNKFGTYAARPSSEPVVMTSP